MSKIIGLLLFVIAFFCAFSGKAESRITDKTVSRTLAILDKELSNRDAYVNKRQEAIDSIKNVLNSCDTVDNRYFNVLLELGNRYSGYLTDSALIYYRRGEAMGEMLNNPYYKVTFQMKKLATLPAAGFMVNAVSEFETINLDSLPTPQRIEALEAGRQMYSYVAAFYVKYPDYNKWKEKIMAMQSELLKILPDSSLLYMHTKGEYAFLSGDYVTAKVLLTKVFETVDPKSNLAARSANILGRIADINNSREEHFYYLAVSAIADVISATREVVSLQELGMALYDEGDINRAYMYLNVALSNAVECNALMRLTQTTEALPVISAANRDALERGRQRLVFVLSLSLLLVVVLAGVLLKLYKQMDKTQRLQFTLESANRTKEVYMSQFLNLCTVYMNQLKELCSITARKISTGHVDELYKLAKSGRFVEGQSKNFYDTFDDAFLHIYPNFVDDVNDLLHENEKITLKPNEKLNTDLRILAFMRLGVTDSSKIAEVLNYSLNTIYTYRNKLKNRAINRDTFEKDVMNIRYRDKKEPDNLK